MVIKVLGKGCKNCEKLEANAHEAAKALAVDYTIEKVKDINEIIEYGVLKTPALVINEKLVSSGKIASVGQIKSMIKEALH